ncbi:MAG: YlbF family regulator [Clostridia bacterium]|nr:YlbF family regulator [Clostridia bacterium]
MIKEKATELGLALSNSEEFKRVQQAKAAMDSDPHVQGLMEQYTKKQEQMVNMLENQDNDGMTVSAIAKEIEDIQSELMADPVFIEMMESQNQFANVMNEVNKVISAYINLGEEEESRSSGCSGDCSGCSGCMH